MSLIVSAGVSHFLTKLPSAMPSALVIEGPEGVGVRTIAEHITHTLHARPFIIAPKRKHGAEFVIDMEAGNIVIADIRKLYEQTRTAQPAKHVYVLDTGAQSMTHGAQNAFLKLLEEPRSGVHFIIATHHVNRLLPTVMSRCQHLHVPPVAQTATETLANELTTDPTKRARLAFIGRGRPALIHRLAGDEQAYDKRVRIMTDAKTVINGASYEKLLLAHAYRDRRADATTLLSDAAYQLSILLKRQSDARFSAAIDRYLDTIERITGGGNVRLLLAGAML